MVILRRKGFLWGVGGERYVYRNICVYIYIHTYIHICIFVRASI